MVKHEVRELIPPTIFFMIAFEILAISRTLMLREYHIGISAVAGVVIGALLVAKAVLLADLLPFLRRFHHKPLIYNVLWKTGIYAVAAFVIHYLEHLIPLWWRIGNLVGANRRLYDEMVWPQFWVIHLWLLVLLFMYCAFRELVRAIGPSEVRRLFFGVPGSSASSFPIVGNAN
jgi:hypothetical protein